MITLHLLQLAEEEVFEGLLVWYLEHIGGDEKLVVHAGKGVFYHLLTPAGAEKDTNGWIVTKLHLMLLVVGYVGIELTEVLMRELFVL